jgi:positive regulator of sigma E activity
LGEEVYFIFSVQILEEEIMQVFSLFELLLVVFAFYAAYEFEGEMRITVVLLCLITVYLLERLEKRIEEDKEVRKRLLRYKLEEEKKKSSPPVRERITEKPS